MYGKLSPDGRLDKIKFSNKTKIIYQETNKEVTALKTKMRELEQSIEQITQEKGDINESKVNLEKQVASLLEEKAQMLK